MTLLLISFLSGVLTILAPCVLPLLPIIIGDSIQETDKKRPYIIAGSLAFSIILFTLLLKASTLLINVSPDFWTSFSGGLVLILGLITLFPNFWNKISAKLSRRSEEALQQSSRKQGWWGSALTGIALGPVFSSCSPTYALVLATVLPQSFAKGMIYMIAYAIGLALMLLLISVFGQKLTKKLNWAANPNGWFKKILGIIFIVVGLAIITGYEKKFEAYLLDQGLFDFSTQIEYQILENFNE